jgi:C-terminal processing protease CtpA/Prc
MQRGRFVYVAYNSTYDSVDLAARIVRLARKPAFRRVILDLRQNGGGNNSKYAPLLNALTNRFVVRRSRPVVLTGRTTFSAAGNFVADIERFTRARLVGEPPGGSPNQWGDFAPVVLPNVGLEAVVATTYVQSGRPDDVRAAIEPHVRVELSTADWLAGRDPALTTALTVR